GTVVAALADLRQPDASRAGLAPQRHETADAPRGANALPPLVADAFGRQLRQALDVGGGSLFGARVNAKVEARAEPQGAEDAQVVFLKPPVGIADGANRFLFQVGRAAERVTPLVTER